LEIEDRIRLETPEGVDLSIQLAGVGSRFACALVDHAIQLTALLGLVLLFNQIGTPVASAAFFVIAFLLIFGYDVAFETFNAGRTPGKRAGGVRVVRVGGEPETFLIAVVRNLMRIVDFLPAAYLVGISSIFATSKNQRLGDIAAGTLVIRERSGRHATPDAAPVERDPHAEAAGWDVSGVSDDELHLAADFLRRRAALPDDVRHRLAAQLAARVRPHVGGATDDLDDEFLLEQVVLLRERRRDARG
jgi:uncharacterized RDD family membrane protein YckC